MRKVVLLIIGILFLLMVFLLLFLIGGSSSKLYYKPASDQGRLMMQPGAADTLSIVYLGDSWAERHKSHPCVIDEIIGKELNIPVKVITVGISGLTSKDIYLSMFNNHDIKSAFIKAPHFCFVVAGINDSDRKMGKKYYKENMRLIITELLANGVVPVVLEIPYYNSYRSFNSRSARVKLRYIRSMMINHEPMDCVASYQKAIRELLDEQHWNDSLIYIDNKSWNPLGYKDARNLYDGGQMHLNERGYLVLDSCIAQSVVNFLSLSDISSRLPIGGRSHGN